MTDAQKIPMTRSLSAMAQSRARAEIAKLGLALPGRVVAVDGPIVTVNFEVRGPRLFPVVTMPVFGPEYIRYPVQVGDKGVAFPADVYLGGVSGLGGGTADSSLPGNLSALVWFPCGNKNWTPPPGADANTLAAYGKTATLLLDSAAGNSSLKLTDTGVTLAFGGHSIVIDSAGVHIDGRLFLAHEHGTVQPGTGVSGGVV